MHGHLRRRKMHAFRGSPSPGIRNFMEECTGIPLPTEWS
jgi:hypothetical protein